MELKQGGVLFEKKFGNITYRIPIMSVIELPEINYNNCIYHSFLGGRHRKSFFPEGFGHHIRKLENQDYCTMLFAIEQANGSNGFPDIGKRIYEIQLEEINKPNEGVVKSRIAFMSEPKETSGAKKVNLFIKRKDEEKLLHDMLEGRGFKGLNIFNDDEEDIPTGYHPLSNLAAYSVNGELWLGKKAELNNVPGTIVTLDLILKNN